MFAGATILGDGSIALILDVVAIARAAGLTFKEIEDVPVGPDKQSTISKGVVDQYLLCQISDDRRLASGAAIP